jgi:hypothetical protein
MRGIPQNAAARPTADADKAIAAKNRKGSLKKCSSTRVPAKSKGTETPAMVLGGPSFRHFENLEKGQRKILKGVIDATLEPVMLPFLACSRIPTIRLSVRHEFHRCSLILAAPIQNQPATLLQWIDREESKLS